jgi:hypothetical protein
MTKSGLAAVRERIRLAFVNQVHGDLRDEAQVRASREMIAEIEKPVGRPIEAIRKHFTEEFDKARQTPQPITEPPAQAAQNSPLKAENEYAEHDERAFHVRSNYLSHAALRSVHINSHQVLPRGVHQCYLVEAPTESIGELFEQALKQLEGK